MTTRCNIWSPLVGLSLVSAAALVGGAPFVPVALAGPGHGIVPVVALADQPNQIDGLTVEEGKDGTTTLRMQGTDEPTFNVYRLSEPERLVVDISRSQRGKVVPRLPLDTWAAGRLTIDDIQEQDSRLVRMVVQLKRDASYIVVPDGSDLVVTITPREVPPEQYFARKSAVDRRAEIEAEKRSAQSLKAQASALQQQASARAFEAERRLKAAKTRTAAAQRAEARAKEAEAAALAALKETRTGKASLRRELERARQLRKQAEDGRRRAEQSLATAKQAAARDRDAAKAARTQARAAAQEAQRLKVEARETLDTVQSTLQQAETKKREAARRLQAASHKDEAAAKRLKEAELQRRAATRARKEAADALAKARKQSRRAGRVRKLEKALVAAQTAEEAAQADARRAVTSRRSTEQALQVASEAVKAERRRVVSIQAELTAKESALVKARRQVDVERKTAANARQEAAQARQTAADVQVRAQRALAAAEQAIARAQSEKNEASEARQRAEKALAAAREKATSDDAKGRVAVQHEQALAAARSVEREARVRQQQAEKRLKALAADRDVLAAKLEAQRQVSAQLEQGIADRERRLQALEQEVAAARQRLARAPRDPEKAALQAKRLQATVTVLEQQVERLRGETAAAKAKAQQAESRLAKHSPNERSGDASERLRDEVEQARRLARELNERLADREQRLAAVEREKKTMQAQLAQQSGESKQGKGLAAKNAESRRELNAAESKLAAVRKSLDRETGRLAKVENEVDRAQARLDERLRELEREGHSSAPTGPVKPVARVTDVRFEDDQDEERVVIDVDGPIHYEGGTLTPTLQMLRVSKASISSALERSLDATRFRGPVKTITSFGEDGHVKVIVATRDEVVPVVEKGDKQLVWRFPRSQSSGKSEVVSLAGTKVGGFTSSAAPKMMAPSAVKAATGDPGSRGRWRGERIDIELQQAPIKDVLLLFSDIGRVNIIAGRGVEGVVTMKLTGVPWDQALDIILRSLNLGVVREGNVLRVATLKDLEDERREAIERAKALVQLKPLETRLVPVSYATAQEMQSKVTAVLSSRGSVTTDTRTNTLIVMDVAENIALAEELVGRLDSQTPQVLIEARIVEARTNFLRQLGIQWGFGFIASPGTGNPTGLLFPNSIGAAGGATGQPLDARGLILPGVAGNPNYAVDLPAPVGTGAGGALGFSFGNINGTLQTNLRLSAAEDNGEVRIISAPKIVTLDNTAAQIEQGVQIPISQVSAQGVNTRYVNATLALKVTPHVTNEGAVLLDVTVQKNEADFINTGARGDPTILTKQAQSRMLVNDGDTAVIGGIYTRNKSVNFKKVPWIAEIPIIGWFFKNKSEADTRTEVLIFLTPKIVNRASSIGG